MIKLSQVEDPQGQLFKLKDINKDKSIERILFLNFHYSHLLNKSIRLWKLLGKLKKNLILNSRSNSYKNLVLEISYPILDILKKFLNKVLLNFLPKRVKCYWLMFGQPGVVPVKSLWLTINKCWLKIIGETK